VKFEPYPPGEGSPLVGSVLDAGDARPDRQGLRHAHHDGPALAETYARKPSFYGSTYCCGCSCTGRSASDGEFVWDGTDERVGT
jgi:hypothetical protein